MVEIEEDEAERIHRIAILQILEQTLVRELSPDCTVSEFNFETLHPSISVLAGGKTYQFGFDRDGAKNHSLHLEAWANTCAWESEEALTAANNILIMIRRGITFRGIRY